MLIGLTGLHRAGKSHFRKSGVAEKYGFLVVNKKQVVVDLFTAACGNRTMENLDDENFNDSIIWKDANTWYGQQMKENPIYITELIVDSAIEKYGEDILLDAIHNNLEWDIIKKHLPDSALLLFATPKEIRDQRCGTDSITEADNKNLRRLSFWTSSKELPSLPCMASWCINGALPMEEIEQNFASFVGFLKEGKRPKELVGVDFSIDDMQDFILQDLLLQLQGVQAENSSLKRMIEELKKEVCPTLA